jgi:hypothetical protein
LVVVVAAAAFDAAEVRVGEYGPYYRNVEGESDTHSEWIAAIALFGGAPIAGALVYASIVLSGTRRLRGSHWRFVSFALGLPVACLVGIGVFVLTYGNVWLFVPEEPS